MATTAATLPLHIRGLKEAIFIEAKKKYDFAGDILGKKMDTPALRETIATLSTLSPAVALAESAGIPIQSIGTTHKRNYDLVLYGTGVEITARAQRTDLTDSLGTVRDKLAGSYYKTRQIMASNLLNLGTTTTLSLFGVPLFSASQPTDSGTWSNITSGGGPLSVSLVELMVDDVRRNHKEYTGSAPWAPPTSFDLILGSSNSELLAERILNTTLQQGTANNDINAVRKRLNLKRINPWLQGSMVVLLPEENPLFWLEGAGMQIREDLTTGIGQAGHVKKYFMEFDATVGALLPHGVQYASGA